LNVLECAWYDIISREDAKKDEDFELEYAVREEYKEKYGVACKKYEVFSITVITYNTPGLKCPSPTSHKKLRLFKIELKQLSGEIKYWLGN
jgi:hypothetical protein